MGCGALPRLSSHTIVKDGNLIVSYASSQETDVYDAVSPSASIRSDKSNQSSSFAAKEQAPFDVDDLESDAPSLADTIADMQDFETQAGLSSASSRSFPHETSTCCIDMRLHPLAVATSCSQEKADIQSNNPTVGDLGNPSDVSSIHDDASIASAHSDICVTLLPSGNPSSEVASSTSSKNVHGYNHSSTSRVRRGISNNSPQEALFTHLDSAAAGNGYMDHSTTIRSKDSMMVQVSAPKHPSLAGASNTVAALGRH